ncbi:MAG TPA: VWA domain-containing protein [Gaiellaceae bacterium]|nr:VWA domain-containing protein [Gaiellaceae bacterium]
MDLRLVTPLGALLALTALAPVGVFVLRLRRLRGLRGALGLAEPPLRSQLAVLASLVIVPALLGLAAAQPVLATTETVRERTDAQGFVVLDVSRSMLASARPGAPTRLERAREIALRLREELPEVPFGIASLTDRVLPHLFPTTDAAVFTATLERAVGIEQPPPGAFYLTVATNLNALRSLPERSYFLPSARKRLAVVLTDGETELPLDDLAAPFRRRPRIEVLFVRLWGEDERIYETGVPEGGYRPDRQRTALLERTATLVGGHVFEERDVQGAAAALRATAGRGSVATRRLDSGRLALMPYLTAAALLPLAVVLLRRSVWWRWRLPARRRSQAAPRPEGAKVSSARGVAQPG